VVLVIVAGLEVRVAGSDDLMEGLHELGEAREGYDEAWDYYKGVVPETFASAGLARRLGRTAGRYRVNVGKLPITALADRLKVSALTALAEDGSRDDEANGKLQTALTAARMGLEWPRLIRRVLVYGDSYQFVWQGDTEGTCTIAYNSPLTTRVLYDPEDETVARLAIKRWRDKGTVRASLIWPDRIEKGWVLTEGKSEDDPKSWERERDAQDIPNPYSRIPIIHYRNDLPYGTPDHEDAYGPQDGVGKMSAVLGYAVEAHGLKERYALAEPGASLNGDGPSPDWDDDADAGPNEQNESSQLRGGPGYMAWLEGIRAVGEWSTPDVATFLDPAKFYLQASAMTTGTPMRYVTGDGNAPSGESLRVADAPLAAKAANRQDYIGDAAAQMGSLVLEVLGMPGRRVDVRWAPAGIVDDKATWDICQAKIAAGVPQRVALVETGLYDQDEVDGWLRDATAEMDVARRVAILSDVAGALGNIGQAVTLGLLTDAEATAVIGATIGQLTPQLEVTA